MPIERQPEAANLMDALRRSIAAEKPARASPGKTADRNLSKHPDHDARRSLHGQSLISPPPRWVRLMLGGVLIDPNALKING
jgi:hypothetical protein